MLTLLVQWPRSSSAPSPRSKLKLMRGCRLVSLPKDTPRHPGTAGLFSKRRLTRARRGLIPMHRLARMPPEFCRTTPATIGGRRQVRRQGFPPQAGVAALRSPGNRQDLLDQGPRLSHPATHRGRAIGSDRDESGTVVSWEGAATAHPMVVRVRSVVRGGPWSALCRVLRGERFSSLAG